MIAKAAALLRRMGGKTLASTDAALNRLYGWRYNPLYQSGTLVVVAFLAMLGTGLYLLLFYRIGSPYESVAGLQDQVLLGRWIRALHRYASDLAVVAGLLHALRMFIQGRTWGQRTLAWLSGLVLMFLLFACGWTGYVMVWDRFGFLLAREGAQLLDVLPIFSEPISRAFVGEHPMPPAFFFLNLFLHVAIPIGLALLLWIHVSRVARPVLLPPRGLLWGSLGLMFAASVLVPAPLGPRADLYARIGTVDLDVVYGFFLPFALAPRDAWLALVGLSLVAVLVPWWSRPRASDRGGPTVVVSRLCTGCKQCTLDCPFDALEMVEHPDDPLGLVSQVDPSRCVSCGICTASCAPMALGPPGRSGRDELARAREFTADRKLRPTDVILLPCRNGTADFIERAALLDDVHVYPVACVGHLHTSILEFFVRSGVGGVLIASCPPRDCRNREGPRWLEQRMDYGREAELRPSVERRRIDVVHAGAAEGRLVLDALSAFRGRLAELEHAEAENTIDLELECEEKPLEDRL
jgi:coenzyme F420-reducing hydrogenase delta subunit/NAD-dependent dihydropyrimidine dehydrogenase PreA subunit